jgi:hypothetical protein
MDILIIGLSWIIICALGNHYCRNFQCYNEWEISKTCDLVRLAYFKCALGLRFNRKDLAFRFNRKTKFQDIANGCFYNYPCFHTSHNHVNPSTRHGNMLLNTPPHSICNHFWYFVNKHKFVLQMLFITLRHVHQVNH